MHVCCVSDCICVWALILDGSFVVTRVLVTSMHVIFVEACVSAVETRFGGTGCVHACAGCVHARLVQLDLII